MPRHEGRRYSLWRIMTTGPPANVDGPPFPGLKIPRWPLIGSGTERQLNMFFGAATNSQHSLCGRFNAKPTDQQSRSSCPWQPCMHNHVRHTLSSHLVVSATGHGTRIRSFG
jgi:hypothetical protein